MADPTVDLWAIDEVHFQQHGSRCRLWVTPETKDPVLRHHPTRHSVGYFGAVRRCDGRFQFRRETDKFNGLTFFEFMKGLYQTSLSSGRRVVVITDNAKYHHARLHRQWREEHATEVCTGLLASLQPGVESDRAGVETDPAAVLAQPILPAAPGGHDHGGKGVRRLGRSQRNLAPTMRNYLRRYVLVPYMSGRWPRHPGSHLHPWEMIVGLDRLPSNPATDVGIVSEHARTYVTHHS